MNKSTQRTSRSLFFKWAATLDYKYFVASKHDSQKLFSSDHLPSILTSSNIYINKNSSKFFSDS